MKRWSRASMLIAAAALLTAALAAAFSLAGVGPSSARGRGSAGRGGSLIGGRSAASTPRLSSSSSSSSPGPESSDGRRRQAVSRRQSWQDGLTAVGLWSLALGLTPAVGRAADAAPAATGAGPRLWVSGKGAQPKGSKDRTGTKRDSSYLRCLSDCTTECRKPGQGPSKESNECLELCQAYCCQTYEQCTYLLQPE